jgi:hypothetical protein
MLLIAVFFNSRKCLPFSHWLICKSHDGPHGKVAKVTCGMQVADPWLSVLFVGLLFRLGLVMIIFRHFRKVYCANTLAFLNGIISLLHRFVLLVQEINGKFLENIRHDLFGKFKFL